MPEITKSRKRSSKTKPPTDSIEQLQEQAQIEEEMLRPGEWEAEWKAWLEQNPKANVFERIEAIPEGNVGECHAYLYRLYPVAKNEGQYTNIGKWTFPPYPTLEQFKIDHGGGKYTLMLKRGGGKFSRTLGEWTFSVSDVAPKFQPGQTDGAGRPLATPGVTAAGSTATETKNETVEVARTFERILDKQGKGGEAAVQSAVSIMKTGMENALEIQKNAGQSLTGNGFADRIIEKYLEEKDKPGTPSEIDMLTKVIDLAQKLNPKSTPRNEMDMLAMIEHITGLATKLFGVENLPALFARLNGGGEAPAAHTKENTWVELGRLVLGGLEKLPAIMQNWIQIQQQQARIAAAANPAAPPGSAAAPPIVNAPQIPPGTATVIPPAAGRDYLMEMVTGIIRAYDAGYDGQAAAIHVKICLPDDILLQIQPMFADAIQVHAWMQNIPELALRSQEVEWKQFQDEFLEEMNNVELPADELVPAAGEEQKPD